LQKNSLKNPSAFLCELGGEISVLFFNQTGRAAAGGAAACPAKPLGEAGTSETFYLYPFTFRS
jgi:hypothetical protein